MANPPHDTLENKNDNNKRRPGLTNPPHPQSHGGWLVATPKAIEDGLQPLLYLGVWFVSHP